MFSTFLTKTYLHDVTLPFEIQALFQPHIKQICKRCGLIASLVLVKRHGIVREAILPLQSNNICLLQTLINL